MKPTRSDIILLSVLLSIALVAGLLLWCFIPRGMGATVRVDGKVIFRLDLAEDTTVLVNDTHTLTVRDGYVWVESAPCPKQTCVHHAPISREGETIVCAEYVLTITVEAASPAEKKGGTHG